MTPLISISDLIHDSWVSFKADWKTILKRNAWIIPVSVVYFALYLAGIAAHQTWIGMVAMLVLIVGSLLVSLHSTRYVLAKDAGATVQATTQKGLAELALPVIFIGIITSIATLGGFFLLIIPAIWFWLASHFAILAYLEEGTTGVNAISRSMELVKGRWWKTFWRLALPALLIQAVLGIILTVVYLIPIIVAFVGGAAAMMSFSEGGNPGFGAASIPVLILAAILFIAALLVNLFISLVATGFLQVAQAKLFHSLKNSRE